ncbi:MAG: hypothetical protein J6P57_07155 [Lachnospiraceae bacterium]|nr:hypothetical protein [Lachnospiraceae bacterium]
MSSVKKLIGEIKSDINKETNIREYAKLLYEKYNYYATIKMSMNYYTMKEIISDMTDKNSDVCKYFDVLSRLVKDNIIENKPVDEEALTAVKQIRDNIEYKMKILTSYTDGYEIYEYILNRIEAKVKKSVEEVDIALLSDKMYSYVFNESDKMVINSKLQLLMAQLPVRMTKSKFCDVVSNTLALYKGGEKTSLDEFCDMLRTSSLITKPKGFETEYPFLYHVYTDLAAADYKELSEDEYDALNGRLNEAADIINEEASNYILMQEIANDIYTILLTIEDTIGTNEKLPAYKASVNIIKSSMESEDFESLSEILMDSFVSLEGVQEEVTESIMPLEAAFDDIYVGKNEDIKAYGLSDRFETLDKISRLLSTSLFIDVEKSARNESDMVDDKYYNETKDKLIADFMSLFSDCGRPVVRSIMCKILSAMPIFLNTKQEIKDYFDYTLSGCKDMSELTACNKLITEMIEEDY